MRKLYEKTQVISNFLKHVIIELCKYMYGVIGKEPSDYKILYFPELQTENYN